LVVSHHATKGAPPTRIFFTRDQNPQLSGGRNELEVFGLRGDVELGETGRALVVERREDEPARRGIAKNDGGHPLLTKREHR
jgi:hypothetical protein